MKERMVKQRASKYKLNFEKNRLAGQLGSQLQNGQHNFTLVSIVRENWCDRYAKGKKSSIELLLMEKIILTWINTIIYPI